MRPCVRSLLGPLLAGALALASGTPAAAEAEVGAEGTAGLEARLAALASPYTAIRDEARAALVAGWGRESPPARALLARLAEAKGRAREALVGVLVEAGDDDVAREALRAVLRGGRLASRNVLLDLFRRRETAQVVRRLLEADRAAFQDPLAWGLGGAEEAARLDLLVHLARRADVEARFMARKSPTGSTGYYKGQYEGLRLHGDRRLALDVVLGIALDEAMPLPGERGFGTYRLLVPTDVELWELEGMAMNAVAELATPEDEAALSRLEVALAETTRRMAEDRRLLRRRSRDEEVHSRRFQDDLLQVGEDLSTTADLVTTLYAIDPVRYAPALERFLDDLDLNWSYPVTPQQAIGLKPAVLIRVGRYAEAIDLYRRELGFDSGASGAFNYYNMACAYASWSLETEGKEAERLRQLAEECLVRCYQRGWRDVGWMDEDRDLDPIRDGEVYARVRRLILDDLGLPQAPPPERR